MTAIRRWLARPAMTRGEIVFIAAVVAVANGIQALAGISDGMTLLVVIGMVIAGRAAWEVSHLVSRRKGEL